MEQPVWYWVPCAGPQDWCTTPSDAFPQWRGSFFVSTLKWAGPGAHRVARDRTAAKEERFQDKQVKRRIRNVRQGPDGALYLLVDSSDGEILRIGPRKAQANRAAPSSHFPLPAVLFPEVP